MVGEWVQEGGAQMEEDDDWEEVEEVWDDVNGEALSPALVKEGRREEVQYIVGRKIWSLRPVEERWEKTGKAPVSVRWVDLDKVCDVDGVWELLVRGRLVARNFKGKDRSRDDLFAETPPLEAKRIILKRAAIQRGYGGWRNVMFIDAKEAHVNPRCEDDVYIKLP